ncbi:uncharacterized protein LOC135690231 [Rhopilema esculentum]|uniref:uncharacterized protein LOC135690231 n=1 Tax=Rhopilema esculentum TaxID=499914 RepID=UPI0031DAA6A3
MGAPIARGHGIGAIVIGALEILFGLIIMICSFVVGGKIAGNASLSPYWAGIPYLIPGILGIVSGVTKNFCAMVAFMVLNIICFIIDGIAAILMFLIIGIWASIVSELTNNCSNRTILGKNWCYCSHNGAVYKYQVDSCSTIKTIVSLLWCIVVFAIFAAIVALAGSILGCIATCCRGSQNTTVIVQAPGTVVQPGQQQNAPPSYPMS